VGGDAEGQRKDPAIGPDLYKQQDPSGRGYTRNGATDMGPPRTRTFVEAKARRGENQGRV
jgi:hypothetical protein